MTSNTPKRGPFKRARGEQLPADEGGGVVTATGAQSGLPVMDLKAADPRADAVGAIPEALARSLNAVPLAHDKGRLIVAAAEPIDRDQLAELEKAAGSPVTVVLAPPTEVRHL